MLAKFNKGLTVIEMVIAISIISIMLLIIIPTFVNQNETLQLDTLSEELINTFQLVQSHAYTSQKESVVTLNIQNNQIIQIGTQHPAIDNKTIRTNNKSIPTFITVETNLDINKISFQPNKSWKLYNDTVLNQSKNLDITLKSKKDTVTIKFYPNSKTIHLLE